MKVKKGWFTMSEETKAQKKPISVCSIIGIVLAIVALISSPMPIINNASFFLGLIAVVLGLIGLVGALRGKKGGKVVSFVGIVLAVVSCAVVLATQSMYGAALEQTQTELDKMTGDATEQLLQTDVDVQLGEFSISRGGYGLIESSLPVTIANKAKEAKSYSVHLEAVDESGARICDDYLYANSLGSGQSTQVEAFKYVASENFEKMTGAKFNIVEVSQF